MKIQSDRRILRGNHNGINFKYVGGYLVVDFPCVYLSRREIKTAIEVVTLLEAQGFPVKEKLPKPTRVSGIFGGEGEVIKIDDEEGED